jgi:hypothetical protein
VIFSLGWLYTSSAYNMVALYLAPAEAIREIHSGIAYLKAI